MVLSTFNLSGTCNPGSAYADWAWEICTWAWSLKIRGSRSTVILNQMLGIAHSTHLAFTQYAPRKAHTFRMEVRQREIDSR